MPPKEGPSVRRPSMSQTDRAKLMASLREEPTTRVNFELEDSKHQKLKILVAKSEHRSIREFFTAYLDSLPDA